MSNQTRPCGTCGATEGVRLYISGYRCPEHTPSAVRGRPEPSGQYCAPARCYCGNCPPWEPPESATGMDDDTSASYWRTLSQGVPFVPVAPLPQPAENRKRVTMPHAGMAALSLALNTLGR